ncbi:MAG TPA: hypothetical protein VJ698_24080 [Noviherbaspirillum sp.]|uniref:hypothetical protein n=1 Tax=Noviherbaspirillum sp. TaxID=1926288 RepID=UPI002B4A1714|nr:hypothetical protein [Noviherbaspirillum sp.]HJV88565.1 hypothetical protein [Noviherbaspirillum sp.]
MENSLKKSSMLRSGSKRIMSLNGSKRVRFAIVASIKKKRPEIEQRFAAPSRACARDEVQHNASAALMIGNGLYFAMTEVNPIPEAAGRIVLRVPCSVVRIA